MSKVKKINTNNFKIEKNVISFKETLIQISNISQVDIAPIPDKKYNLWAILVGIIGFFLAQTNSSSKTVGWLLILGAIAYTVYIFWTNSQNTGQYLNIFLNSGNIYCIVCDSKFFLENVMKVIEYCVNNQTNQDIKIDFDNCKLYNSPITLGKENEIHL